MIGPICYAVNVFRLWCHVRRMKLEWDLMNNIKHVFVTLAQKRKNWVKLRKWKKRTSSGKFERDELT